MLEIVSWTYSSVLWAIHRSYKIEKETFKSFSDPGTFLSGAVAGGVGRLAVLPFDNGGSKGVKQTIGRRMPQFGLLLMFYSHVASRLLPGLETDPPSKMLTTFMIGAGAGFSMRFLCNPLGRVADECLRTGKTPIEVMRIFRSKTILQFWYCSPNLIANGLYFGVFFTVFEGLRRYTERNLLPLQKTGVTELVAEFGEGAAEIMNTAAAHVTSSPEAVYRNYSNYNYMTTAAVNCALGGTAAAIASTICYPYSAHRYLQTVIHDSAICRGLLPTLIKEVPMMAVMFGTFSLLQPFLAPRHGVRCGFGY